MRSADTVLQEKEIYQTSLEVRDAVLIINPSAGGGRRMHQLDEARHILRKAGIETELQMTTAPGEATEMARHVVRPFPNVTVQSFEGLTVQFVKRIGARVILRGLRTLSDMEYEFGMTLTNHRLDPTDRQSGSELGDRLAHLRNDSLRGQRGANSQNLV